MPRFFFLFFPLCFLISCNLNQKGSGKDTNQKDQEQEFADPGKIANLKIGNAGEYSQILEMLNKKDLKSIDLAIKIFRNAKADSLSRDSMLVAFNDFLSVMAGTYLENNDSLQGKSGIDISEAVTRQMKERLSGYGMMLTTSEGDFYLEPDNDYLIQNFSDKISPAYNEFLQITASDQKEKFADDSSILIPIDSLAKRITVWEDFMEKYPSFVSIGKAQDYYSQYLETYLSGTDNSKAFDIKSNKLKDDLKKSFEGYIAESPGRKSAAIVKDYYDLLKSSGFLYSEKVDAFILEKVYNN
jgi:hypothetical protein